MHSIDSVQQLYPLLNFFSPNLYSYFSSIHRRGLGNRSDPFQFSYSDADFTVMVIWFLNWSCLDFFLKKVSPPKLISFCLESEFNQGKGIFVCAQSDMTNLIQPSWCGNLIWFSDLIKSLLDFRTEWTVCKCKAVWNFKNRGKYDTLDL